MTDVQIAESLVNKTRNYRPSEVANLIVEGIRQAQVMSLKKRQDALEALLVDTQKARLPNEHER